MSFCDVLVIGGGPAGCTAATVLAREGWDVVLLEKDVHPRFHIGESLLPNNLPILERLGVAEAVRAIGVFKPGAEIVSDALGTSVAFPFSYGLNPDYTHSYQVERARFDEILFRNARASGVRAVEGVRVTGFRAAREGERGEVVAGDGVTYRPRFVLDASGRDTFMATRLKNKRSDKENSTAAVFAHYRNVEFRRGETEGYISIHLVKDGWFWLIPLPDGVMSVGFVGDRVAFRGAKGQALLEAKIAESARVAPRMREAERISEVVTTGNYSYCADRAWGRGFYMIGDAFAFLDPVFSSGVYMAMSSAERGAAVASAWLRNPARGRVAARRAERLTRREAGRIGWLIKRINRPVLRDMLMHPRNFLWMRDGLVSMLAGNLGRSPRTLVPVLAFKGAYCLLAWRARRGVAGRP